MSPTLIGTMRKSLVCVCIRNTSSTCGICACAVQPARKRCVFTREETGRLLEHFCPGPRDRHYPTTQVPILQSPITDPLLLRETSRCTIVWSALEHPTAPSCCLHLSYFKFVSLSIVAMYYREKKSPRARIDHCVYP